MGFSPLPAKALSWNDWFRVFHKLVNRWCPRLLNIVLLRPYFTRWCLRVREASALFNRSRCIAGCIISVQVNRFATFTTGEMRLLNEMPSVSTFFRGMVGQGFGFQDCSKFDYANINGSCCRESITSKVWLFNGGIRGLPTSCNASYSAHYQWRRVAPACMYGWAA